MRWAETILDEPRAAGRVQPRGTATIRRTRQITNSDCGIAAMSMLADVPYLVARAALFRPGERCRGTTNARMRKALQTFGIAHSPRFRRFESWDKIPGHALVHVRWKALPRTDPGHWVVYQRLTPGYRVLDPGSFAETLTAIDTGPMIGQAFLLVDIAHRGASTVSEDAPAARRRPAARAPLRGGKRPDKPL